MKNTSGKASNGTGPYKGVRDFYPEDQRIQNYIFSAMRRAVESFGYEEMNASVLEPTELYTAKTSEEIIKEQTYTFTDRGNRSVTLRPEMTPTVARMVANRKRELGFPLRLYSIPNLFRYERPQRGRLREHWQLNTDIFGVAGIEADIEIVEVAYQVMKELGASDEMFTIRMNSRVMLNTLYEPILKNGVNKEQLFRLIDKKAKMNKEEYLDEWLKLTNHPFKEVTIEQSQTLQIIFETLAKKNIRVELAPEVVRGFDYYTDIVFEVFDTNPENPRSLFGGGRYDNLVGQYGAENVPAVGFGMGDVTARDFLETHNLLPALSSSTHLYLAPVTPNELESVSRCADLLRSQKINVALGMKHEKIGDHIKAATKLGIPYFAVYGPDEAASNMLKIKKLSSGEEKEIALNEVASYILSPGR